MIDQEVKPVGDTGDNLIAEEIFFSEKTEKKKPPRVLSMYDYKKFKFIENIDVKYEFGAHLGMGSFGKVRRCRHKDSGSEFAMKIINKELIQERKVYLELLENELSILGKKSHPKIIRIIDLLEDTGHYYIISEIVEGGELFKRL